MAVAVAEILIAQQTVLQTGLSSDSQLQEQAELEFSVAH
jgi:hypothetical protein